MACNICGKGMGIFGGDMAFTCPVCGADICKECAEKYGNPKEYGGFFGSEHAEITCPACHSTIKIR
jgi:DNA-directed RNA polymerase subunit RPC12/RpoP